MINLNVNSFITTREASQIYKKHDLTINKVVHQYFEEDKDFRRISAGATKNAELLINKNCLEDYFADPTKYRKRTSIHNRTHITDRNYRI